MQQLGALLGGPHAARKAAKEIEPERRRERLDPVADRALGRVKPLRRRRDPAEPGDRDDLRSPSRCLKRMGRVQFR
ncbi:hypothetical protein LNKW23_42560 [Paralimibaculum aggregatum]|uniref:Uncharacterized protein n=1 Tax=Paralimibaculum aggregatum TaxID=3036245 RepID=A0ABQ6LSI1_9RHOB|nr:hypothetical protein LNKW23_42560 [Limibaculum sp. NKW23]